MKRKAIDVTDFLILVAVWELEEGYWELLTIVRLRNAIALARESQLTRLVFPTGVKPHGVWGGIYKNRITKTNSKKVDSLQKRQERVLQLLYKSPGQTRESLASHLGVSVATIGQVLRKLEKIGVIHHRPHPSQNKTKLYYAADSAPATSTEVTSSISRAVPDVSREPQLRIYFVDPRSLQRSKQ